MRPLGLRTRHDGLRRPELNRRNVRGFPSHQRTLTSLGAAALTLRKPVSGPGNAAEPRTARSWRRVASSRASSPTMSLCCARAAKSSACARAVSTTPVRLTSGAHVGSLESCTSSPAVGWSGRLTSLSEPPPSPTGATLGDKSCPEATSSQEFESSSAPLN